MFPLACLLVLLSGVRSLCVTVFQHDLAAVLAAPNVTRTGVEAPFVQTVHPGFGTGVTYVFRDFDFTTIDKLWLGFDPRHPPGLGFDGTLQELRPTSPLLPSAKVLRWLGDLQTTGHVRKQKQARLSCTASLPWRSASELTALDPDVSAIGYVLEVTGDFQVTCLFEVKNGDSWVPSLQYYCSALPAGACESNSSMAGYKDSLEFVFYHTPACNSTFSVVGPGFPPAPFDYWSNGTTGNSSFSYNFPHLDATLKLFHAMDPASWPRLSLDTELDDVPRGEFMSFSHLAAGDTQMVFTGRVRELLSGRSDNASSLEYGPLLPSRMTVSLSHGHRWLPSAVLTSQDPLFAIDAARVPAVAQIRAASGYGLHFLAELFVDGQWLPAGLHYDRVKSPSQFRSDVRVSFSLAFYWLPNRPPVAVDDALTVLEDSLLSDAVDVLANDFDPDCQPVRFSGAEPRLQLGAPTPTQRSGNVSTTPLGALRVTPPPDFFGVAYATYNITDGLLPSMRPGKVRVTVVPVNDPPSFEAASITAFWNRRFAQSAWAYDIVAGPANERDDRSQQPLTFTVAADRPLAFSEPPAVSSDGTLTFVPARNFSGTVTIEVTLRDAGGLANGGRDSFSRNFTVDVIVGEPKLSDELRVVRATTLLKNAAVPSGAVFAGLFGGTVCFVLWRRRRLQPSPALPFSSPRRRTSPSSRERPFDKHE